MIFATGRDPCLNFFGSGLKKKFEMLINTNKLYMVGDVKSGIYRQTAICVENGIKAALEIYRNTRNNSV